MQGILCVFPGDESHRMNLEPLDLTDVYYIYIECKKELVNARNRSPF
ncbi:hypothetical protein HMPREF1205_04226 [Bacteroides fragilis HMW 616]|nr:hypothetical protein HMPREF1205_04226 [Bacteroides fragilis HMW 616]